MKTEKFKVGGMHCKSCEMLIKDSLEELGVKDISFEKEIITITFDETKISLEDIKKVIQSIMKTETEYVIISALIETSKKEITEKAVIKTTSSINRIRKLTKDAYQCLLREGVKNTLLKIKQFERMSHPNEDLIINEFNKNKFVVKNKIDFGKTLGSTDYIFLFSKEKN